MAKRLLFLTGVAICCVILFHATGYGFTAMFAWAHRYRDVTSPNFDAAGTLPYYVLRLIEQLVVFAIPAFLFVSGFFISVLAGRSHTAVNAHAIGARIRALVVPYLIWSVLALTAVALQGRVYSVPQYLGLLATGATTQVYYYVPLLVQLYIIAPLIVLGANRNWKVLLAATAALQVAAYAGQYVVILGGPGAAGLTIVLQKWFFAVHLFWFTFGVVAGFQQRPLRLLLERWRGLLMASVVVLFALGVVEWELLLRWSGESWVGTRPTLIDGLYSGAAILSFLATPDWEIPHSNWLVALGVRSYGIYLVHGLAMEYFSRFTYHVAPWVLGWQILYQPMLIGVGLAVPLLLMGFVNRYGSAGLYKSLFG